MRRWKTNYSAQRFKHFFGIIILDVDHFKEVNDTHGHHVGDQVLVDMADLLKSNVRTTDTLGRWGGEEFLIICPEADEAGTANLAENLRNAIASHKFPVVQSKTASFGVTIHQQGESIKSVIARADKALYVAKNSGRNRVKTL